MLATTRAHKKPAVRLTETDYDTIAGLIQAAGSDQPGIPLLEAELARAVVLRNSASMRSIVKLNSSVEYQDLTTGRVRRLQVGLPKDASIDDNRISVLTPVGAALIGMRVGSTFEWTDASGRRRVLKVLSVQDDDG